MAITQIAAVIKEKERLTPSVLKVRFQLEHPLNYEPGQFISIHFPVEGNIVRRSYSIANLDAVSPTSLVDIVLTVLPDGLASQFLDKAHHGDGVHISGPYGAMTVPKELPQRLLLVATSTGVAPFVNMMPRLVDMVESSEQAVQAELLVGVRNRSEELFQEHLRALARQHDWLSVGFCLSRDTPAEDDEFEGYVHQRLKALAPNPSQDLAYLCGNPAMVDEAFQQLAQYGFTPRQVKREKYVASRTP